jgi:hypothetical protein
MGVQAGHNAGSGRGANRLRYIRIFENETLISQPIEMRDLYPIISVAGHSVAALLVTENKDDVRFLRHISPSIY